MKGQIIKKDGKKYKVIEIIEDFKTIKYKNKEYRIVEWENKPIEALINKDFSCKKYKGFYLSTFQEFNELIENDLLVIEDFGDYITRHFNRKQWKRDFCLSRCFVDGDKDFCLSRCFLNGNANLNSYISSLSYSYDGGRVVIVK